MPNDAETMKLTLDKSGDFTPIKDVPVHAFESLVNEYGLVRVKITKDFAPYTPNPELGWTVAGFDPPLAKKIYDLAAGYPVDEKLQPISLEGEIAEPPPPVAVKTVDIPEDWEDLHQFPLIRLAKAIKGTDETMTVVEAKAVIKTELERRQAHAA